jgi:hypothetical protein
MSAGVVPSSEYLIESRILDTAVSAVTFSNLDQFAGVYRHLKIVSSARDTNSYAGGLVIRMIFNGSGSGYAWHLLQGGGTGANSVGSGNGTGQPYMRGGYYLGGGLVANSFGSSITNILDFASSSKNKTIMALTGEPQHTSALISGFWQSTNPVTSITLSADITSFAVGSRFSLYGVTA